MATGWHAAVSAGVKSGMTVVVVGDGAVGLCAVLAASELGAERVIAMSRHQPRQQLAEEFGATEIVAERGDEGVARIRELTNSVGADAVLGAWALVTRCCKPCNPPDPGPWSAGSAHRTG
jgi:threonine dehydrogenase-like Zn-dependent dehydrogenase